MVARRTRLGNRNRPARPFWGTNRSRDASRPIAPLPTCVGAGLPDRTMDLPLWKARERFGYSPAAPRRSALPIPVTELRLMAASHQHHRADKPVGKLPLLGA